MDKVTAGRDAMSKFAPKFAELNDDVLFGEVWSREEQLSPRDRSLITVSALMASGIGHLAPSSHSAGEGQWRHAHGDERGADAARLLCGLAQGVGGAEDGEGSLWRGMTWSARLPSATC